MERILFYHGQTPDNVRFTIAGRFEGEEIVMGIALCSKNDQFCKKLGRVKATGRSYAKRGRPGMYTINLYSETLPEKYWEGKETRVFRDKLSVLEKAKTSQLKYLFNMDEK
jgi:hypothetical protein